MATIACPINSCQQQINSKIYRSHHHQRLRSNGTEKSWKTSIRLIGSMHKTKSTKTKKRSSTIITNMQYSSGPNTYDKRSINRNSTAERNQDDSRIRNHSYNQLLKNLKFVRLVQRRLRGHLSEVFMYLGPDVWNFLL